jgi:hypothetical protein
MGQSFPRSFQNPKSRYSSVLTHQEQPDILNWTAPNPARGPSFLQSHRWLLSFQPMSPPQEIPPEPHPQSLLQKTLSPETGNPDGPSPICLKQITGPLFHGSTLDGFCHDQSYCTIPNASQQKNHNKGSPGPIHPLTANLESPDPDRKPKSCSM